MAKNTRDYRKNFASGGWVPPPNAEDAAGNPTRGHWKFGEFVHGESSEEETKNSLAHPGRTVPSYDPFVDVYPTGTAKKREKLERAVKDRYRATGDAFGYSGSGSSSELMGDVVPDWAQREKAERGYNKGGLVRRRKK